MVYAVLLYGFRVGRLIDLSFCVDISTNNLDSLSGSLSGGDDMGMGAAFMIKFRG